MVRVRTKLVQVYALERKNSVRTGVSTHNFKERKVLLRTQTVSE